MSKQRISPLWCFRVWLCLAVLLLVVGKPVTAAGQQTGFLDRVYRDTAGDHKYVVFVPNNYKADKQWPVILYLHGAGQRGTDGKRQTTDGLGKFVKARAKTFPFLVVFPQCEDLKGPILKAWTAGSPDGKRALKILDAVEKDFSVNKKQEILTGWSMGGYGAWSLAAAKPKRWAAVVPLSGGGDPKQAIKLKDVPIWAFHGADDAIVHPSETRQMIDAVKAAGGHPQYNELKGVAHNTWSVVYDSDASQNNLFAWMRNPQQIPSEFGSFRPTPGTRPSTKPDTEEPFVPAVEIPRAVYVRLGNDMLKSLAYSIPKIAPQDALTGRVASMQEFSVTEGIQFQTDFTQISYSGELGRAHVEAVKPDQMNIQLGLENLTLTIGRTFLREVGGRRSAQAGPISVVIGHQRPVWLSIVVTPYVKDRKLKLKLVTARFDIPDDNWYVTTPQILKRRGLGVTRRRVRNGLVNGLYGSKARIEKQVELMVPKLLEQLEDNMQLDKVTDFVGSIWPLPVYRPRIRVWPQEVSTDKDGLSIVFGITAAAVDPRTAPQTPRKIEVVGTKIGDVPKTTNLQVGIAPAMLQPLTDLLIQANVARIHVGDIPEKTFSLFTDRDTLAKAIPDLKRYPKNVEIWAELSLAAPLSISQAAADSKAAMLQFDVPGIVISLAIKTDPKKADWTPYAEFKFNVAQQVRVSVSRLNYESRAIRMDWFGDPKIKAVGRFASGYKPQAPGLDVEQIRKLFVRSWTAWTSSGPVAKLPVSDVDLGYTKLRLSDVGWSNPHLYAVFAAPGVKITNSSKILLVYETKGPYSGWGGPYTLEPGKSHEFPIGYPLTYRRQTAAGLVTFTLPAGTHSEFRVPKDGGEANLYKARETIPKQTANKE